MFGVTLRVPLGGEEVVVAAASAWKGPPDRRPCRIDCAIALVRVEEATNPAKMGIRLTPHGEMFLPFDLDEFRSGCIEAQLKMIGEPPRRAW